MASGIPSARVKPVRGSTWHSGDHERAVQVEGLEAHTRAVDDQRRIRRDAHMRWVHLGLRSCIRFKFAVWRLPENMET